MEQLIGIIPVAGQDLDYQFFFNDNFIPIGKNFLAIERSIAECCFFKCTSIWIVLPKYTEPVIKQRVGDVVYRWDQFRKNLQPVPVYYIGLHPRDIGRRDSIPWSVICAGGVIKKFAKKFSPQILPEKFWISFPFGVYPFSHLTVKLLQTIWKKDVRVVLQGFDEFEGKMLDVFSGGMLGCTLFLEDFAKMRNSFRKQAVGEFLRTPRGVYPSEKVPIEDRWSGRWLQMKDVLSDLDLSNVYYHNVGSYAGIETWKKYSFFLSRRWASQMVRSKKVFRMKPKRTTKIGREPPNEKSNS